jgi:uncharacterized membrane protein
MEQFMGLFRNPKRIFVTGLIVFLPVFVTGWLLKILFDALDGPVAGLIQAQLGRRLPGLGLLLMLVAIFLVGMLASNIVGARLLRSFERLLMRVPVVRSIYGPAKQLFQAMAKEDTSEQEVVAVEFPRRGLYMVGFVTRRDPHGVTVFLPTTPNPTSGFLIACDAQEVTPLPMTFDEAMQMIVSGGFVGPGAAIVPRSTPAIRAAER